jgi:hypothetical protein
MEKIKSQKQLEVESAIIEKMAMVQKDMLAIVDNAFNCGVPLSKRQQETPYGFMMDILTLGLAWLSNQNAPKDLSSIRDMNRFKRHIGTWRDIS